MCVCGVYFLEKWSQIYEHFKTISVIIVVLSIIFPGLWVRQKYLSIILLSSAIAIFALIDRISSTQSATKFLRQHNNIHHVNFKTIIIGILISSIVFFGFWVQQKYLTITMIFFVIIILYLF